MSLPSVRSNSTLTPIENLDHLEGVSQVTQSNSVLPSLTDSSLNAIFVQTKDKSIVDDIVSPQTDNSRTELGMLHLNGDTLQSEVPESSESHTESEMIKSLKSRIILPSVLKHVWKVNKQTDFLSNKRTSGSATPPNDSYSGPDVTFNVGSDIKDSVNRRTEEVAMKDSDEEGNGKNTIADDTDNARKQTIDEHESTSKKSSQIIDDAESSNNYSENIFDSDFYDDVNGHDKNTFFVDENFLDAVSNHRRRVSMTSDSKKLSRTEQPKSRRSSVYYETNNSPEDNLHITSHETIDDKSIQVTRNEHLISSNSQEDSLLHASFKVQDNGKKITHIGENNQKGFASKGIGEDGNSKDEDNNEEAFYLDMLPNNKVNKSDGDVIHKNNTDSISGDTQSEMCLNNNWELLNKNTNDKNTTKANIKSDKEDIQRHEMANIQLRNSTEEQIQVMNTVGLSNIGGESTDVQSTDSGENVHGQRDMSTKHWKAWASVDQDDSSHTFNLEPIVREKYKEILISADDDDKHTLESTGENNRKRSLTNGSDTRVEPDESNLLSVDHSTQGLLADATHPLKSMSEGNVDETENIEEERKDDMYSKYERVKGKEDSKSNRKSGTNDQRVKNSKYERVKEKQDSKSNSKSGSSNQSVKNSKTPPEASLNLPMSNRQSNYKSIVEMKALDRLLTGPYSENISKKSPSPRRGTYRNSTKASFNRIHTQDRYIKLADFEGDNKTSKSETNNRENSSRKLGGSNTTTGSAKSNTNNSISIFTEPLQETRPVKAATDQIADNKTVRDETNKPEIVSHQDKHDPAETKSEIISKPPVWQSETNDMFEPVITNSLEHTVSIESETVSEVEKNSTSKEDGIVTSAENMVTSIPENTFEENTLEENTTFPTQDKQEEVLDNDNSSHAKQEELEIIKNSNLNDSLGERNTQKDKTDISETGNKRTHEREWSIARTKFKTLLPNLGKTKERIHKVRKRNGDQTLDVKEIFTKTNQDSHETVGSAAKKRDEPTNPKSQDAKVIPTSAAKKKEEPSNYKTRATNGSVMKNIEEPSNPNICDTKTVGLAAKKREALSTLKTQDAKDTKESAIKEKEETSISLPRGVKRTVGSATKKREEQSNPKTKNLSETGGSSNTKSEESTTGKTQDTKETIGSATKNRELPNPTNKDTEEAEGSTTKKTHNPTNPKTWESEETNKLIIEKKEELSISNNQDSNEKTEADMEKIKELLVPKTKDLKETPESRTLKTEEHAPTDQLITSPASIIIVDETEPPQTKTNFSIDQVIMQDILHKCKTKPTEDYNNSTNLPNGSPESPSHEPLIGNGFSKYEDRNPAKSLSIHSLTVPSLQTNPFSGDPPLDEDTISIYSRRDSVRHSFDSGSRRSVDYRIRNTALVVLPTTDDTPKSVLTNEESFIKNAIPFLPMKMAVLCLILNIFVPGSGTALSGLAILCCGQPRVLNKDDQILITLCANCMVGLAQLFTITFLLVGWFWSVSWGIEMIILSVEHEKNLKELRNKEMQSLALNAFGSPKRPIMFGS